MEEERQFDYNPVDDPECMSGNGDIKVPDCAFCKYSDGTKCKFFDLDKLTVPVDIFDCQYLEKSEQGEKSIDKMFGMDR